jgi:hypothetical protein
MPEKKDEAGNPENPCEKPADREWADLCQQWRMAESAKEQLRLLGRQNDLIVASNELFSRQNHFLELQNYLMVGEGALIGLGLIFTGFGLWHTARTNNRNDNTTRAELRAYVFVEKHNLAFDGLAGIFRASYSINNSGTTPAYRMTHRSIIKVCAHPLPPNSPMPQLAQISPGTTTVHKGITVDGICENRNPITAEERADMLRQTHRIYVFGRVDYYDALGDSHWTTFCVSIVESHLLMGAPNGTRMTITHEYSAQHNNAN